MIQYLYHLFICQYALKDFIKFARKYHSIFLQVNGKTSNHTLDDGDDDDDDDDEDEEVKGVPDIKIQGNVIKIDRKDVVWSSDEYEESDEEEATSKVKVEIVMETIKSMYSQRLSISFMIQSMTNTVPSNII